MTVQFFLIQYDKTKFVQNTFFSFLKYSDITDTLEINKVWSRKDFGKLN